MFGDYTCVARNHLGSLRKVVTLAEGAKPGVPHVTVENIDQVRNTGPGWSKESRLHAPANSRHLGFERFLQGDW